MPRLPKVNATAIKARLPTRLPKNLSRSLYEAVSNLTSAPSTRRALTPSTATQGARVRKNPFRRAGTGEEHIIEEDCWLLVFPMSCCCS